MLLSHHTAPAGMLNYYRANNGGALKLQCSYEYIIIIIIISRQK